jgi:uncharacterized protein (DUF488 family)
MGNPFFTIGHSTRAVAEFVDLLAQAEIGMLVDVRTLPRSRTNPQFNRDTLPGTLAQFRIEYEHAAALGGLRGKSREMAPDVNGFWRIQSFHNFADYALGASFRSALMQLRQLGRERRCAIMCAEAMWWRCHRRIITDYLIAAGESVFHIVASRRIEPARMTESAIVHPDGTVTYPAMHGNAARSRSPSS